MIGFDIGGTKCAVCVGDVRDGSLVIYDKQVIPTRHDLSPYAILDQLCALAGEMTHDFSRIGISCGGPLDSARGLILSPPNLPGWDNVEVCDYLRRRFGGQVTLQNDANACAVAEWRYGAGRGTQNMIFLTFGSGLGAGLILGGRLYTGACDMAGEVGHVRLASYGPVGYGKAGSFEGFCSGNGIAALGRMMAQEKLQMGQAPAFCPDAASLELLTAKSIAEAADRGDEDARAVYRLSGGMLGRGLAVLIDILNPEMIVIGSVFARSEALLRDAMEQTLQQESLAYARRACQILPAALGDRIGDYAALSIAAM